MTQAWVAHVDSHTDKLVLLALADNANDAGECYPSLMNIAQRCEMHRTTVVHAIQSLEAAGHLSRQIRSGRNTFYMVHPSLSATSSAEQPVAQNNQSLSATNQSLSATSPSPLINPSPSENRHKPSKRTRVTIPDEPPPSNLNVEAWHRWEQYRREIRKALKPASIPAAQRQLAAYGPDQEAVVEQSIANGYQGLFALKSVQKNKPKQASEWM